MIYLVVGIPALLAALFIVDGIILLHERRNKLRDKRKINYEK